MDDLMKDIIDILDIKQTRGGGIIRFQGKREFTLDAFLKNFYLASPALNKHKHEPLEPHDYFTRIIEYVEESNHEKRQGIQQFKNVEEFLYWSIEENKIVFDELGRIDSIASDNSMNILKLSLYEYNTQAKEAGMPILNVATYEDSLAKITYDIRKKKQEEVREKLEFDSNASDKGFEIIVNQMIPENDYKKPLHVAALKHIIWQTKRKMSGHHILDPLMLYISGKQGQGKSSIVRRLFGDPLGHFYTEQDLADALDVRSMESKQSHYFMLIDEMVSLNTSTVANLKKLITSDKESSRLLGTNTVMLVRNNLTLAATSNYDLTATIYDETGLRRFWEIKFKLDEGQVIDWDKIAGIDMDELWRSVDENIEIGYYHRELSNYPAMVAHQKESVPKSYVHLFLYSQNYLSNDSSEYAWVKQSDLFKMYKNWAKDNEVKNSTQNVLWFHRKVTNLGIECREFNRQPAYYINNSDGSCAAVSDDSPEDLPVVTEDEKSDSKLVRKSNVKKFHKDDVIPYKEVKDDEEN